jgi:hypothetical protein
MFFWAMNITDMSFSLDSFLDHCSRSKRYCRSVKGAHQREEITVRGILCFDDTFLARIQLAISKHLYKCLLFSLCFPSLMILASVQLSKIIYPADTVSRLIFFCSASWLYLLVLLGAEFLILSIPTSCMNVNQRDALVARIFSASCRAEEINAYNEITEIIQFRRNFDRPQCLLALGGLALNCLCSNNIIINAILSGNLAAIWNQSYLGSIILLATCILGISWLFLVKFPLFWMYRTRNQISRYDTSL